MASASLSGSGTDFAYNIFFRRHGRGKYVGLFPLVPARIPPVNSMLANGFWLPHRYVHVLVYQHALA